MDKLKNIRKIAIIIMLLNVPIIYAQEATQNGTIGPPSKILQEPVPDYLITKSNDFIKSYLGEDYFNQHLSLIDNTTIQSGTGQKNYIVSYTYNVSANYLSPDAKHVAVTFSQDGAIIDYLGPKKTHTFSITKQKAIEIAGNDNLKGPYQAEIDRVASSNTIDGYVWVVTGNIDVSTCRIIGATRECLIPGKYIDVDNGSIIGNFTTSNLIQSSIQNSSSRGSRQNQIRTYIITFLIGILIVAFGIMYKDKLNKDKLNKDKLNKDKLNKDKLNKDKMKRKP